MRIEILTSPGCGARDETEAKIRALSEGLGVQADINVIEVATDEMAQELKFPGSPTVRINGRDLEPNIAAQAQFSLG